MRKKAFNFYTRPTPAPKGAPLRAGQLERLLGRLDQYTSTELAEKAGVNGNTILRAAHGKPLTHESARHILNMLDALDKEEEHAHARARRNLEVAGKLLQLECPWDEEGLGHLEACAAAAESHSVRAHTEIYREEIDRLREEIERLRG